LSFWVRSSKTGTHCVAFRNGIDRSYVTTYTVNAANTWEQKSVTVTGGLITAGTWDWTTGAGVSVTFALAVGSTFQTTAGAWQTGSFLATSSQVNCLDSNTNIFAITGVQLEVGSVATPFEHRPYGAELALCQRYYEISSTSISVTGGSSVGTFLKFAVEKRSIPTLTRTGNGAFDTGGNASAITTYGAGVGNGANSQAGGVFTVAAEL
jgi:hypothetical protein